MSEIVAKKGKKTGVPEGPRFGRVKSNLKVRFRLIGDSECNGLIFLFIPVRWEF